MSRPLSWSHRLASRGQTWLSLAALVGAGWVFWAAAELPAAPGGMADGASAPSGPAAAASSAAGNPLVR